MYKYWDFENQIDNSNNDNKKKTVVNKQLRRFKLWNILKVIVMVVTDK